MSKVCLESISACPVLEPKLEDFQNFQAYVELLDKTYSKTCGMVKIVPPKQWRPRHADYDRSIASLSVINPIEQNPFGQGGAYQCLLIQKKSMTIGEYRAKVQSLERGMGPAGPDRMEQLFWKNLAYSPPLYGADVKLSLMEECAGKWNMNALESVLSRGMAGDLDGVNTPYCYIGCWKSFFCWHTEDLQLPAINFLHHGKSKFWYSVPYYQKALLESQVRAFFNTSSTRCPEFLRHKTHIVNPYILKTKCPELQLSKVEQRAGQFIIVFGGSYHCGFNFGFNIAEAVNFGTLGWLRQFPHAKFCTCVSDSVRLSQTSFAAQLKKSPIASRPQVRQFVLQAQRLAKIERGRERKIDKRQEMYLWAQCDECEQWRRLPSRFQPGPTFGCGEVGAKCKR